MMKQTFLYLLLLITLVNISGCRKEPVQMVVTVGSLVVNARDGVGNSLVGTTVYLYNNQIDFNNGSYSKTRITDNSGQVFFDNLDPGMYYVDCDFINQFSQTITIWGNGYVTAGYETTLTIKP